MGLVAGLVCEQIDVNQEPAARTARPSGSGDEMRCERPIVEVRCLSGNFQGPPLDLPLPLELIQCQMHARAVKLLKSAFDTFRAHHFSHVVIRDAGVAQQLQVRTAFIGVDSVTEQAECGGLAIAELSQDAAPAIGGAQGLPEVFRKGPEKPDHRPDIVVRARDGHERGPSDHSFV